MTWFVEEHSFQIPAFKNKKWKKSLKCLGHKLEKQTSAIVNSESNEKATFKNWCSNM